MIVGRRQLIVGAAAAACVGCSARSVETVEVEGSAGSSGTGLETTGFGSSRFGATVQIGTRPQVGLAIDDLGGFLPVVEARAWVVRYPAESLDRAAEVYDAETMEGLKAGFIALYEKCTHLGCRVPECRSSGRFECPCHGGFFNRVGEYVGGPPPRGMDRFPIRVEGESLYLETGTIL